MLQRGRKSVASFGVVPVGGGPSRLQSPSFLSAAERKLFSELVNACDPRHFVRSDLPLMVSFVQATLLSRNSAGDPDKITIWEKATKMQALLATRLRLAPQSRADPKTVARRQIGPKPSYYDHNMEDDCA